MRSVQFFLSAFIIWSCAFAEKGLEKELSDVVLTTGLGKIRGTYLTSNSGRNFYAFRGIRYAQAPVGDLRFKDPVPVDHWNGIFDATEDGPMCPQPAFNGSDVSEDCLRLNVYTHELPSESNPNIRRPVIVYLHPGGFYAVSGQSKNFAGPQYLMNGNIVLVTLNYRLGSLGFISTGTAEAPGNAGLKDQVTALRWIKLHIGRFGGDPNSVTLLGYSAGAVSITLHMISPMSRNLFHKAIVMSGSATSQWGFPSNQIHLARRQARLLNCSTDSSVIDMISCLRTKHYFEFANSFASMFEFGQGNPVLLWKPVVEEDFGQERFLTEDPVRAYQDGRFMKIPLIAGITKDEFVGPAIAILENDTLRDQLDKNFEELAPVCFQYERNTPRSRNISAQLRKTFLDDGPLQLNKSLVGLAHLFGDGLISFGMHRFVHLAARLTKVYYYRFSYQGRYSHLYYPGNKPYGVVHHDDLLYLLVGPFIAPQFFEEDPEYRTMQRLTRMFSAFAYKGGTNAEAEENVVVTTNLGKIRGSSLTSRLGEKFYAFRGIRYAQPPIGELRFKAPVPVESWSNIYDATEDGPMCPQGFRNLSDMSEDCLRLNVYTKVLPIQEQNSESNIKKPVLVYFHPGGFYSVSGQSKNFAGPQLLMDRDIVLVTLNYRLSSLGFLATGTSEAPGNTALKDQVQVLRWVQEHISRFGGNPDSVTLIGYSAGGMSITLHMVSPMSRNLFHKVIVMSGSAIAQWKIPSEQVELAKKQANLVNCKSDDIEQMVKCLKTKSMMDYTQTIGDMFEFGEGNPIILWSPVIEPDFGQERFLIEDPVKSFQDGNFMKIPVIAGITKDEFVGAAIGVLEDDTLRQQMNTEFNKISPICFLYERDTPRSNNISNELRKVFLGNLPLHKTNSIEGLGFLFSDGVIGFGMHRFVRLAARYTKVFNYRFSYQGRFSHLYYPEDKPYGVVHHDDLLYLFAVPSRTPLFPNTDPDHPTIERLTRMWTEFAKNGDPNKPNDEYLRGVRWRPFSFRREPYLDIGEELVMKEGLYTERFAVWKRLFPLQWTPKRNRGMIPNGDDFSEDYPLDIDHDHDHIHDHDHDHIHDHNCQHNKMN